MSKTRQCLVICPFGGARSKVRERSDFILEKYIRPVAEAEGYVAQRSMDDQKPGSITEQVVKSLYEADLVIADITGRNPNVIYELALRHATGKPSIIISDSLKAPFDIQDISIIQIRKDYDVENDESAVEELRNQIKNAKNGEASFKSHVCELLHPCRKYDSSVSVYKWKLIYNGECANKWLALQPDHVKQAVERYKLNNVNSESEHLMGDIAEYSEYKYYHNRESLWDLYCTAKKTTGFLKGWAIDPTKGFTQIAVHGEERRDGNVIIEFHQDEKMGILGVKIRSFDYTIEFSPESGGHRLTGELYHPDYPKSAKGVLIAETTLFTEARSHV